MFWSSIWIKEDGGSLFCCGLTAWSAFKVIKMLSSVGSCHMPELEAAVLQLAHLCTFGCWLPLAALSHTNQRLNKSPWGGAWQKEGILLLGCWQIWKPCLSIAGNLFSKVKFDRGQGLSISPCAAHCLSELGTNVFGNFLVLSLCVMTGMPRPQFGCRSQLVLGDARGDVAPCPLLAHLLLFSPPSTFFPFGLTILFFLKFSSPKPGYNKSLRHIFAPLFPTASSCPAVLMWVTGSTSSCLWEWLSWRSSEVLVLK